MTKHRKRICNKCKKKKRLNAFFKQTSRHGKPGYACWCKICSNINCTNWHRKHKTQSKINRLRQRHGLTLLQFNTLLDSQSNLCMICLKKTELVIDHDHNCCPRNKSCDKCRRGLICRLCNKGIGCLQDNPKILQLALKYLVRFKRTL